MDTSKFLILGANGQLGTALRERYPKAKAIDATILDVSSREAVLAFDWSDVAVILNAAAYTNVDNAETAEGRITSWRVNAVGPRNLAEAAILYNLSLIHISSDYVFDGTHTRHIEDESFSPINTYGQSKAAGDIAVSLVPKHYILRTTWVIGEGKNFVRTILDLGKKAISPTVVNDQIGRLTFTSELVRIIDHLLQSNAAYGTYNATNSGTPTSWSEITRIIFKACGFDLSVGDISSEAYFAEKPGVATRPLQSVMDLSKLTATGFAPHDWHDDLAAYIKKELAL